MSAARELFLEVSPLVARDDQMAYDKLCRAAVLWREDGQHFSAGVAMSQAVDAAWGRPVRMVKALRIALCDFEYVVSERPPESLETIAALHKRHQSLSRASWLFEADRTMMRTRIWEI